MFLGSPCVLRAAFWGALCGKAKEWKCRGCAPQAEVSGWSECLSSFLKGFKKKNAYVHACAWKSWLTSGNPVGTWVFFREEGCYACLCVLALLRWSPIQELAMVRLIWHDQACLDCPGEGRDFVFLMDCDLSASKLPAAERHVGREHIFIFSSFTMLGLIWV